MDVNLALELFKGEKTLFLVLRASLTKNSGEAAKRENGGETQGVGETQGNAGKCGEEQGEQ